MDEALLFQVPGQYECFYNMNLNELVYDIDPVRVACLPCFAQFLASLCVSSHHRDIQLLGGTRNDCIIGAFSNISV